MEVEIAHLRDLNLKGLRMRWRSMLGRSPPDHLPRHLLVAILLYRLQADRSGDLDPQTRQLLEQTPAKEPSAAMVARLLAYDRRQSEIVPGTVLVREWNRRHERVMVLAKGFAWNGQIFDSLSAVAYAITGTRWNGPRFFGLRDRKR